jgi:hypothetical protein
MLLEGAERRVLSVASEVRRGGAAVAGATAVVAGGLYDGGTAVAGAGVDLAGGLLDGALNTGRFLADSTYREEVRGTSQRSALA